MPTAQQMENEAMFAKERALKIALNKKTQKISDLIAQQAMMAEMPNTILVSPQLSYQSIMQDIAVQDSRDAAAEHSILFQTLAKISNVPTATSIMGQLTVDEIG